MSRLSSRSVVTALALLGACAAAPAFAQQQPDLRIPQNLPFNPDVTTNVWADAYGGYRTFGSSSVTAEADDLFLHVDFAFELLANLELGANAELISRDFDNQDIGSESGPSDLFAWGKYQFYRSGNMNVSAGAFVSLPTGDDDKGLGTGNVEPGVFISGGLRGKGAGLLQGYLGLRANGDFDGPGEGDGNDGQTSVLLGIGAATEWKPGLEVFASFDFESERVDHGEAFSQLSAGARWQLSGPWKLQGLAGFGISDAAPDFTLGVGVVYAP